MVLGRDDRRAPASPSGEANQFRLSEEREAFQSVFPIPRLPLFTEPLGCLIDRIDQRLAV
jgi:hypothetical protein